MKTVAGVIEANRDRILQRWHDAARAVASARGLSRPELLNLLPPYLSLLGRTRDPAALTDQQQRLVEGHLSHRLRQGYELNEVLTEFALLGRAIAQCIDEEPAADRPAASEVAGMYAELYLTSTIASKVFTEHLLEDEQREKRYARLITTLVNQAAGTFDRAAVVSGAQFRDVLQLIMEAMSAQTASLLLVDPHDRDKLIAVASAGLADEAVAHYVTSIDSNSFASRVAVEADEPLELGDVATASLPLSDALKHSGIRSLLGVRLPARHTLAGVLYVGLTARRSFTPSELRRLVALADRLLLHLDHAQLVSELRSKVSALQMFVDVLAHDLRGPLMTAKLSASLIGADPREAGRHLPRLTRSLDRADRMVTDLLDAHRVDAGERLPVTMTEFDLVAVARDVADELNQQFPGRVVVQAPAELNGRWSSPYLRRAMWNLVMNGLKYGAANAPVMIAILPSREGVEIAVHNSGPVIPVDQRRRLFKMFSRGTLAPAGAGPSWGLGLALVRGAAEAHEGSVEVVSDSESGTTFTMKLPWMPSEARAGDEPRPQL